MFFATLFALAHGEQRTIRVGILIPPGAVEETYRIFVEELLPLEGSGLSNRPPGQVSSLTKIGFPPPVRPVQELGGGRIEPITLREGRLSAFGWAHCEPLLERDPQR